MKKKPPKPSHCDGLARQQLDEDLSRRLDIVPGEVQESFQPIRSLVADPKPVPARVADLRQDLSKCNGRYNVTWLEMPTCPPPCRAGRISLVQCSTLLQTVPCSAVLCSAPAHLPLGSGLWRRPAQRRPSQP
jgi:hypothetical protein